MARSARRRRFPVHHRPLPHVTAARRPSTKSRGVCYEVVVGCRGAGVPKAGAGVVGVWGAGEAGGLWVGR